MTRSRSSGTQKTMLIWGIHPVMECLSVCPDALEGLWTVPSFGRKKTQAALLKRARFRNIEADATLDFGGLGIPAGAVHQGVAARVRPVWEASLETTVDAFVHDRKQPALFVVCDQVADPQNLGAIVRSAVALGAQAVVAQSRGSAAVTGTVVKASSGAIVHIKFCEVTNLVRALEILKQHGLHAVGLSPEGDMALWGAPLRQPLALVVGAEEKGLRHLVKMSCDTLARIPQMGTIGSLNVASATSIALYEIARQRLSG